jgi:hypothetical protein
MDHIVNNPALDHIDVAILCWASENSPFTKEAIVGRFPGIIEDVEEHVFNSFYNKIIANLTEQFYLSKEIGPGGTAHYSYIQPPEDPSVPPLFKEFCHNYAAAGGKVQSAPFCWQRMKKHKGYKSFVKLLGPALDAQIADRERRKQQGKFVAEWRNLTTWINQRGWEDLVSDEVAPQTEETPEMKRYRSWVADKYGATAKTLLTEAQYLSFVQGNGQFSRINTLLGYPERVFIFERAHTYHYNGMTESLSCYEYLVKLFKAKSE